MKNIKEHIGRNRLTLRAESRQSISCLIKPPIYVVNLISFEMSGDVGHCLTISRHKWILGIPLARNLLGDQS
jgi:hypothetical protein